MIAETAQDRAGTRGGAVVLRLVVSTVALAALVWSWHAAAGLRAVPFEKMAIKIVRGETYGAQMFDDALASPAQGCQPRIQRSELLLRAGLVDASIATGALDRIDAETKALSEAADNLLACSPREGFGWFMRFWTESRRSGLTPAALDDLARSYQFAPREPWISVRRNPVAMAIYARLPASVQDSVRTEFRDLVGAQLYGSAMETLLLAKADIRDQLLAGLSPLNDVTRNGFARALRSNRVEGTVPGLDPVPDRPWFRF